jgi:GT2 family glycosyltransferase
VYIGTDPVEREVELAAGVQDAIDLMTPHCAFFTWGENYGRPDCRVPFTTRFPFKATRQPVVLDFWDAAGTCLTDAFTTIAGWRQLWREVTIDGELYHWSKHYEFEKFIDLPGRTRKAFELMLSGCDERDAAALEARGWRVRDAAGISGDVDAYRQYIRGSRAEFTVAKDQNVRLRSGWFSDRSATYLAAGRPVVTQDTGFGNILPTGEGLFAFSTIDDILGAVDAIDSDYPRHSRRASEIAHEYFDAARVLTRLLSDVGLPPHPPIHAGRSALLHDDLDITPISRCPTTLPVATVSRVLAAPVRTNGHGARTHRPALVSIVVVTFNGLVFTKLCVESVFVSAAQDDFEMIVVDNASSDGTLEYLRTLEAGNARVRVLRNPMNRGFAAAVNQGLATAEGDVLVVLNNDVVVTPGWLDPLVAHLGDPAVGGVGCVTNRIGNDAQVNADYQTYGGLVRFARHYTAAHAGEGFDITTIAMFCFAMRRDTYQRVGPLDEQFGVGLFEDDDYAMRVRAEGYRTVCAEDVFVHHFDKASFGGLTPSGGYAELLEANRRRFEQKWGTRWEPHRHRNEPDYAGLVHRVRELVHSILPSDSVVAVVSRGDDDLIRFGKAAGWHFPQSVGGEYAGFYPLDSAEAIAHLEDVRQRGAGFLLIPHTAAWWLEHYDGFRHHLEEHYTRVVSIQDTCELFALDAHG